MVAFLGPPGDQASGVLATAQRRYQWHLTVRPGNCSLVVAARPSCIAQSWPGPCSEDLGTYFGHHSDITQGSLMPHGGNQSSWAHCDSNPEAAVHVPHASPLC